MKLRLALLLLLLALAPEVSAQVSGPASNIRFGPTDPTNCQAGTGMVFWNTTSGKMRGCNTTDTWTDVGGGAGTGDALVADPLSQFAATTSAQLAGVITNETGTSLLVFNTSPTLVTPVLGVAAATSINGLILTASTGTFTLTNGKTFAVTHGLTLSGTDSTVMTFPTTSATIARTDAANTFTGVQTMTSPSVTTSLVTGSTTFALVNTVATTINFGGVATALNIGAGAETILNFGGHTTASQFRFLEPSGSGTNYSAFKAVAQGANIVYSLPPTVGAAGTVLTDVAGDGVLTWAAGGSGSAAGSDTQVQFNDSSAFGGDAGLTYNKTTNVLTITGGQITVPGAGAGSERIGAAAVATGANSTAMGSAATTGATATGAVAIGATASVTGNVGVAIGLGSVSPAGQVSVGNGATGNAANGVAIGNSAVSAGSVSIGLAATSNATTNFAIGQNSSATGTGSIVIGSSATDGGVANSLILGGMLKNVAGVAEVSNGTAGQWGSLKVGVRDAGTTTVTNGLTVGHQSTGTPAAGLGSATLYRINSTTTADQDAGQTAVLWQVATHASRTADYTLSLVNNGAALAEVFRVKGNALIVQPQTVTAGGTTGAQTIDKPAGTVNIAAGQASVVVTNALVTANSQVFAVMRTADTTGQIKSVVPTAGSFTVTLVSAATGEVSVGFWVLN